MEFESVVEGSDTAPTEEEAEGEGGMGPPLPLSGFTGGASERPSAVPSPAPAAGRVDSSRSLSGVWHRGRASMERRSSTPWTLAALLLVLMVVGAADTGAALALPAGPPGQGLSGPPCGESPHLPGCLPPLIAPGPGELTDPYWPARHPRALHALVKRSAWNHRGGVRGGGLPCGGFWPRPARLCRPRGPRRPCPPGPPRQHRPRPPLTTEHPDVE
ncbi:uncharacterized protein LOC142930550 [Petromyzon marinus]|uniref:uncharacterized protein LOC142930550 n=1 Tax=Petromyzon marinus TaxID=7757 RepID=UPI003F6EF679